LNPEKGILVNKDTHKDIHKNNINSEKELEEYKNRRIDKEALKQVVSGET